MERTGLWAQHGWVARVPGPKRQAWEIQGLLGVLLSG